MASPATPKTPAAQTPIQATPTGSWRHPRFDEITRRQYATTFDQSNVRVIILNIAYLLGSFIAFPLLLQWRLFAFFLQPIVNLGTTWPNATLWTAILVRLIFLYNIGYAFLPIFRRYLKKDDLSDIPLTPSQRAAMGLDPNVSAPPTPGSAYQSPNYVTPPRYARSTPRTSFSNPSERKAGHSPLSGSPLAGLGRSTSNGKSTSNSPFSPNSGSPLFQKAIGGGSADRRRSFGPQSALSSSIFGDSSASNTPGTPTPAPAKASVGLNNRWLYEKGRGSPGRSLFA